MNMLTVQPWCGKPEYWSVEGGVGRQKHADGASGGTSVIEEYDPETDTWTVSQIELPQKLRSHFVFNMELAF